jgi:hypothetical protein
MDKIVLTNDVKSDTIWQKLKERAKSLGFGSYDCKLVVHNNEIVEVDVVRELSKIRAD